jgi:hypothetical protein
MDGREMLTFVLDLASYRLHRFVKINANNVST